MYMNDVYIYTLCMQSCFVHSDRWVCTSGLPSDLALTDSLALQTMEELSKEGEDNPSLPPSLLPPPPLTSVSLFVNVLL